MKKKKEETVLEELSFDNQKRRDTLIADWKKCEKYFKEMQLDSRIANCVNFFEGRQWVAPTKNTKNLPRPVFNITEMIVTSRAGNILGSPVKLNYIADDDETSTRQFSDFAAYQQKEMRQDENNYQAVHDGLVKGTYVYYFYWDELAIGKKGKYEGSLRCEMLDPLSVGVADPQESDCQKQDWIIVKKRLTVSKTKKMCDDEKLKAFVQCDSLDKDYEDEVELDEKNMVTVYYRFFRKNGEVYFEAGTKDVMLFKPKCLNPKVKKTNKFNDEHVDGVNEADTDLEPQTKGAEIYYKANLYPFEIGCLKPKNKSIFGRSEVEDLIPTQKAINFIFALAILNCQQLGSPKIVAKSGALKNQVITNKVGEVLIDYTPIGNQGIYSLQPVPFTQGAMGLAPSMIDLLRTITNSSEVMTGDTIGREMSGVAIAQLQAQSEKPTAMQQKRFWRSLERNGKIMEMFYKLYYEDKDYSYQLTKDEELGYIERNEIIPKKLTATFNGQDYIEKDFNIVVEAGAGTQYSEIQSMSMLDNLLQNQMIDLTTYVEMYPESAMPFKEEMKRYIQAKENSELEQLKNLCEQQQGELQQLSAYCKQQESSIKELMSQINKTAKDNQNIIDEFTEKINFANEMIASLQNKGKTKSAKKEEDESK